MKLGYILFYVGDVQKSIDFYKQAFDLEVGFLHESHQYGEMVTGVTKLGFVGHETAMSHQFEYTKSNLKEKPWGQVVSYVRDLNGNLVEICSEMGG